MAVGSCPNCGRCGHCGHVPHKPYPSYPNPWVNPKINPPYFPYVGDWPSPSRTWPTVTWNGSSSG